ncbi:SDR family oxidoreductase [Photobacterium aphoticum]|uniref:Curlin n=1 Tax=Photobacterium aphoticum TaxID=754436 RepID=A0A0J1GQR0_9GAMM|nr:SDR family oxidoreductase [Photobacterium aphoticum]KLV02108.1 curlin [Photobacterium aphoticum]PSU60363.1 SDR family oxidoreductase [Photobacterium aphoticum]GHA35241.1 short-chain dehydrogenase [Photobacterium aphoticum]
MATVLITGANRGLGLEFARQYAEKGWQVLATCRTPETADHLQTLAKTHTDIELLRVDVTDEADILALASHLSGRAIDHLILNAGVLGDDCATLGEMTQAKWLEVLTINTVAPALLIQALRDNVAASEHKTIVGISTRVASLGDNTSGNMYSYRASKAALNQILVSAAQNLREQGVKTLAIHPGWVQTDMGGTSATFTPQESVSGIIQVAENLTLEESGSFRVFDGTAIEW